MSTHTLEESQRLHQAVARYRVVISRYGKPKKVVGSDLAYTEACGLEAQQAKALAEAEPHLAGRMCRSIALLELTNKAEVARILGYGPNFCYERACAAVAALRRGPDARTPAGNPA